MKIDGLTEEQQALIDGISANLVVGKVVVTRAIKTKSGGDFFVGMSAAWDTTQEDAGGMGADLIDAMEEGEQQEALSQRGMTLKKARIAGLILSMNVDRQALMHALGGGAISQKDFANAVKASRYNHQRLLAKVVGGKMKNGDEE